MADTDPCSPDLSGIQVLSAVTMAALDRELKLRQAIGLGAVMETGAIALGIFGPYALKLLIDGLTDKSMPLPTLLATAALFVLSWCGAAVLGNWRMAYSTRVIDRLTQVLAMRALRTQLPEFARTRAGNGGHLLGLIERLPYALTIVIDGLLWRIVPLALQLAGSIVLIASVIPIAYAVFLGLVMTAYAFASCLSAARHQSHAVAANYAAGVASAELGDVIRNARRVVLNGALDAESTLIKSRFEAKARANQRMIWSFIWGAVAQYGVLGFGLVALLGLAVSDTMHGRMSVSDFVLLQAYAFRLVGPLSGFGFIVAQAASAIDTTKQILALGWEAPKGKGRLELPENAAEVRLDHVGFRYGDGPARLEDVSAVIAPGAFVVIVGPNGSGKSTLAQLIAGLLKPCSGTIRVGGLDIAAVAREEQYKLALYVPQMMTLFNRSLRENALYPPTTQTEAGLTKLLVEWRFYDAVHTIDLSRIAGEGGERLSGGQLQKLELARVAGVRVPLLILDESTSALDPASEAIVIQTLRKEMAGRTTLIVVTHRRSLAEAADLVLFVKGGRLVRQGTHAKLIADSGAYQRLWSAAT